MDEQDLNKLNKIEQAKKISDGLASFESALKEKNDSLSLEDKYNKLLEDYKKLSTLYNTEVQQDGPKSYQDQYADILKKLINNPKKIGESRVGNIRSRFGETIRVDLTKEFPLQDIKKVKFSNIVHELLWMIEGNTNVKYLIENDCHIWTDDAYRYYKEKYAIYENINKVEKRLERGNELIYLSKEEFVEKVLNGEHLTIPVLGGGGKSYFYGDLDRVYGKQWRDFAGYSDQLQNCIDTLRTNPDDRRMIVVAHNPKDIEKKVVGLPSCHNYFQFYTNTDINGKRKLSTFVNIRSNDFFLGNPYNVAQYALLTAIIASVVDMDVDELHINMVDCHLYEKHVEPANEWLKRYSELKSDTYCTSKLTIKRNLTSIDDLSATDFEISDYNPQSYIKAQLLT